MSILVKKYLACETCGHFDKEHDTEGEVCYAEEACDCNKFVNIQAITKDIAISLLDALAGYSEEERHKLADEVLIRLINDPAITTRFEAMHKWYA